MEKHEIEDLLKRAKDLEKSQHIHKPYAESTGMLPDFEVEYELDIDPELSSVKPCQGMRCDFLYEGDDPATNGIHMIWPEILNDEGGVILDKRIAIPHSGRATMWIGQHESRVTVHRNRIRVGVKGYWVIGSKKLAKVEVTKIIGLFDNEE